uniref:Lipocalin/cytosolic fatty-acid binding domain-containing protein n=1 Tax=Sus scrofa TaxID=9823 RepID=A0A8D1MVT8_PIG
MKILLLSLILGLVWATEPQPDQDASQISGDWNTLYVASTNPEKTSENGTLKPYLRSITFENGKSKIIFTFFIKVNGKCRASSAEGRKIAPNVYEIDYSGKNEFHIDHVSKNSMIVYDINVDEEGKKSIITAINGKGKKAEEQDLKKFKELTRKKGIPEENIVNVIETDDCPTQ